MLIVSWKKNFAVTLPLPGNDRKFKDILDVAANELLGFFILPHLLRLGTSVLWFRHSYSFCSGWYWNCHYLSLLWTTWTGPECLGFEFRGDRVREDPQYPLLVVQRDFNVRSFGRGRKNRRVVLQQVSRDKDLFSHSRFSLILAPHPLEKWLINIFFQ